MHLTPPHPLSSDYILIYDNFNNYFDPIISLSSVPTYIIITCNIKQFANKLMMENAFIV